MTMVETGKALVLERITAKTATAGGLTRSLPVENDQRIQEDTINSSRFTSLSLRGFPNSLR